MRAPACSRKAPPGSASSGCHGRSRCGNGAIGSCSCAGPKAMNGPTCRMQRLLPGTLRRPLDADAPPHFTAPSGSAVPIDYEAQEGPKLAIRVQELFGLDRHPSIAAGRVALVLELLSPAHRPVQVTRDLPG